MEENKELLAAYADDSLSITEIAERFNLTWNYVQRNRLKYRRQLGLGPLPRGRKNVVYQERLLLVAHLTTRKTISVEGGRESLELLRELIHLLPTVKSTIVYEWNPTTMSWDRQ